MPAFNIKKWIILPFIVINSFFLKKNYNNFKMATLPILVKSKVKLKKT